jgi:hypothetical protein
MVFVYLLQSVVSTSNDIYTSNFDIYREREREEERRKNDTHSKESTDVHVFVDVCPSEVIENIRL